MLPTLNVGPCCSAPADGQLSASLQGHEPARVSALTFLSCVSCPRTFSPLSCFHHSPPLLTLPVHVVTMSWRSRRVHTPQLAFCECASADFRVARLRLLDKPPLGIACVRSVSLLRYTFTIFWQRWHRARSHPSPRLKLCAGPSAMLMPTAPRTRGCFPRTLFWSFFPFFRTKR